MLLLILVIDINCDVRYRVGNTLRFPRVTREPPRTIVLWGLTLATVPAGVFVYFLRWYRITNQKLCSNQEIALNHYTSPGEWRAMTPVGIARVRRPRRAVFSRRLRPCPRKASAQSDPGRRELLRIIPNGSKLLRILYQLRNLKAATLFGGSSKRRPSPEKS